MIDSIFVALSGMQGHQRGLSVISNNVANMNTPGFRGSTLTFADVFNGAPRSLPGGQSSLGSGLSAAFTVMDLTTGEAQQTGNDLDLRLDGSGFFVLQDESGALRYTRNGSFEFNAEGQLVARGQKLKVMARNASGQLVPIELKDLQKNPPKATSEVTLERILSSEDEDHVIESLVVFDKAGGKHTLKVEFKNETPDPNPTNVIVWKVTVFEGTTEVGAGEVRFLGSIPEPGSSPLALTLDLKDAGATEIAFNFDAVTSIDIGASSSLAVQKQDGRLTGEISARSFDERGVLKLTYSNGEKADGPALVLAVIANESEMIQVGNSLFEYRGATPATLREAGDELKVMSQSLERSNVDLTEEFSELILMQRGYQASSQVVSTANDMLQELLDLRSRR
jgi:flagellar hook protein FlgE